MAERLEVLKTYKLYINGVFPRTESGRSLKIKGAKGDVLAHICHGSRKDLRDAVEAARGAQSGWSSRTAYNRAQIMYRMAEMLEARRDEFVTILRQSSGATPNAAKKEVDASIDRLVCFAGWADKFAQMLGCNNQVAGPYYNFTVPEATGIVGIVCPDEPALLGLVTLLAPAMCAGNTCVVITSDRYPLPGAVFGEVCATSDVPAGVVNIVTGKRDELLEHMANHRNVSAISAADLNKSQSHILRLGSAENVKRVTMVKRSAEAWYDEHECETPWAIEPLVDMKTIWHPSGT